MSTKTMRPPPRRVLTASSSTTSINNTSGIGISNIISNKRKERDNSFGFDGIKSKSMLAAGTVGMSKPNAPSHIGSKPGPDSGLRVPNNSNQLLVAGYLAHEFLSKGTLFGQVWDPTRFVSSERTIPNPGYNGGEEAKSKPVPAPVKQEQRQHRHEEELKEEEDEKEHERYMEVATLLKAGGALLPGIINPSQLAGFLQL